MKDSKITKTKLQLKASCPKNDDLLTHFKSKERRFIHKPQIDLVSKIITLAKECLELQKAYQEETDPNS